MALPMYGKLAPEIDERTIELRKFLRVAKLPTPPPSFNIHDDLQLEDNAWFNNSKYGDCVIAARAHQTLVFEKVEQGRRLIIIDQEVIDEYFRQSGGLDMGLVMIKSLKQWRKEGWPIAQQIYKIHAFANVNWKDHEEVCQGIYLLNGLNLGMEVPKYAEDAFSRGEYFWTLQEANDEIIGGHAIYAMGYNDVGPVVMTWGTQVQMTWAFWDKYVDECYAIVDAKDAWLGDNSPLDIEMMDQRLQEITGVSPSEPEPPAPSFWRTVREYLKKIFGWL